MNLAYDARMQGTAPMVTASRRHLMQVSGLCGRTLHRSITELQRKHAVVVLSKGDHRERPSRFRLISDAEAWTRILADGRIGKTRRGAVYVTSARRLLTPQEIERYDLNGLVAALIPPAPIATSWKPKTTRPGWLVG